jgi:integrase
MPRRAQYLDKWDEYIMSRRLKLRSPNTIATYENAGKQCWEFAKENNWPTDPRKITPFHVLDWFEELREDYSSNTQEIYTGALLRFLDWCGNQFCKDLSLHIHPARTGRVDWMSSSQELALFLHSTRKPWDRAIALVIAHTGARASEAADLRLQDMHEEYITLRGKGRKERNVPVDKEFWEDLLPYREYRSSLATSSDRFLVHLWQGKVWEYNLHSINQVIKNMGLAFGRHVSPHTLRRTFGRLLWKAGMPLLIISRILGHTTLEQTVDYLGIDHADLSGAMAAYKPSFRPTTVSE